MKITLTKILKLLLACSVCLISTAYAESNNECQNQSLSPKGLTVAGNTITPGQNVTISLLSDKGKQEATVVLKLKKMKNAVVVNGEIKNIGSCELSTHMPVSLYPIRNGLPLGWHSLPEGVELSNPTLKPGRFVKFYKEYSIDYAGGFNLKVGTFNISPSNETVENNADACSDKAIAQQLEKLADKESKNEMDTCQSTQAMNRLNEAMLEVLNKCSSKSKETQLLKKDIHQTITKTNQKSSQYCSHPDKANSESHVAGNSGSKNQHGVKSSECSDQVLAQRVQEIADRETMGVSGICDSARAMKRVYEKSLQVLEPCVDATKLQEVYDGIEQTNQTISGSCG